MIQILDTKYDPEVLSTSHTKYTHPVVPLVNMRNQSVENAVQDDDLDYALPFVILMVRLVVMCLMSYMVMKMRLRFLYFISLFATVVLLLCLAFISNPALFGLNLSATTLRLIKTIIICLHVFFIQFGVQTLPGSATNRLIGEFVQSRRRPLLGPSPG